MSIRINKNVSITLYALAVVAGTILVSSCRVGPSARNHAAVRSAAGVNAEIDLAGKPVKLFGELLAVEDDGFLIRRHNLSVVRVDASAITSARFARKKLKTGAGRQLTRQQLESLRPLSRYPQGMPPEVLKRYLNVAGQESVLEYR